MLGLPPSFMLDAAKQLEPFEQGRFDNLCGLYTIINAVRLIAPISTRESRCMFERGVAYLDERNWLSTILVEGMSTRLFGSLARHIFAFHQDRLEVLSGPRRVRRANLAHDNVELAVLESLLAKIPVMVLIDGPLNHFSVVCGFTPERLKLFDSYGYRWISRKHCTFGGKRDARHKLSAWIAR